MSRLFIELYLDEDVDVLVADLLRGKGFSAITTRDAHQRGRSDAEQLAYAADQKKTFLTHNRVDFEDLAREYWASGRSHHGIIFAVRRIPHEIVRRLLPLLNQVTADEMIDQVRYL
jgi:predicted nuclease of predicted toxin-antitoxin system